MPNIKTKDTTQTFTLRGGGIAATIKGRMKQHEAEISKCLNKIADVLKEKSEDYDTLAMKAAALMMALSQDDDILNTDTVAVKAQVDRAAYLTKERLDLSCIMLNLDDNTMYEVSLEEAKRYGLV